MERNFGLGGNNEKRTLYLVGLCDIDVEMIKNRFGDNLSIEIINNLVFAAFRIVDYCPSVVVFDYDLKDQRSVLRVVSMMRVMQKLNRTKIICYGSESLAWEFRHQGTNYFVLKGPDTKLHDVITEAMSKIFF